MIHLQFTPIFIPTGDSAPMTDADVKAFIGIWIVLNIIWAIGWIIYGIRYLVYKFRNDLSYFEMFESLVFGNIAMVVCWVLIGLVYAGVVVSRFL